MRCGLNWTLGAVVVLSRSVQAATPEAINFHTANAAEAADVARQAAVVAERVAAHSSDVAHDTAAALRYTRDALKRANANSEDVAELGRQADKLESEAGVASGDAEAASGSARGGSSSGHSRRHTEVAEIREGAGGRQSRDEQGTSSGGDRSDSSRHSSSRHSSSASSTSASSRHTSSRSGDSEAGLSGAVENEEPGRGLDIDARIAPYPNGVEPFGQEEPAKKLTKASVKESDGMIDQIETAQGVEAKRAVYRSLTKLRGATIASYDGMAKGHLGNVDRYNTKHSWRKEHPMRHLAEEEADVNVWAFPKSGSKTTKKKKAPAGISASPAPAPA